MDDYIKVIAALFSSEISNSKKILSVIFLLLLLWAINDYIGWTRNYNINQKIEQYSNYIEINPQYDTSNDAIQYKQKILEDMKNNSNFLDSTLLFLSSNSIIFHKIISGGVLFWIMALVVFFQKKANNKITGFLIFLFSIIPIAIGFLISSSYSLLVIYFLGIIIQIIFIVILYLIGKNK